jgi:hypothetical protein
MWGKPPFSISDNSVLNVRNLINARDWYKQSEVKMNRQEDSGRPFADLAISNDDTFLSLRESVPAAAAEKPHVIFYAKNLEKAHGWLIDRGVSVRPITTDSGGNHLFQFEDLEGNLIEICVEP